MAVFPFLLVLILSMTCHTHELSKSDKDKIERGLQAGKGIADFLATDDFPTSLSGFFKRAAPFLGMVGPFVGLIMSFVPAKDYQVELMKKMMRNIDNKFHQMDRRLDDINRKIDWFDDKVSLDRIQQNVLAVKSKFELLYDAPDNVTLHEMKQEYIDNYKGNFQLASEKLYNCLMNENGLRKAILEYTKYNRKETTVLLVSISKLLLQAINLELAYKTLRYGDAHVKHMTGVWQRKLAKVGRKIELTDLECIKEYPNQLNRDVDEYMAEHNDESHDSFASGLYDHVSTRYYWRDWLVLAYKPIYGYENHCLAQRSGTIRFRDATFKHNLMVASKDKTDRRMNRESARRLMQNVYLFKKISNWWGRWLELRSAQEVFMKLYPHEETLVHGLIVVKWWNALESETIKYYHAKETTVYVRKDCGTCLGNHFYEMIMFG